MGLHRVLSMRVGVPDPHGLDAFYGEVGLHHDSTGGYTGTHDGPVVQVEQYDFRRLLAVDIGADDEAAWAAAGGGTFAFEHIGNAWGPNMPAEFVAPDDLEALKQAWANRR